MKNHNDCPEHHVVQAMTGAIAYGIAHGMQLADMEDALQAAIIHYILYHSFDSDSARTNLATLN